MSDDTERVTAPPKGEDPEFDAMADKVWKALLLVGNPANVTEERARDTLAARMAEFGNG